MAFAISTLSLGSLKYFTGFDGLFNAFLTSLHQVSTYFYRFKIALCTTFR